MPTEVHSWRCNKCHRTYSTFAEASECEETCTQPRKWSAPPNPDASVRFSDE